MLLRVAFFVLMALGLVGFGTVAWITTRPPPSAQAAEAAPTKQAVLTVAHTLRAGGLIKPEDLAAKEVASPQAAGEFTLDTPDARRALVGAMVRRTLSAGEMLRADDIMKPGDHGFLAAVLEPGARAVTIPVDATSGLAGLVWPGDRVDLILTQSSSDSSLPLGKRVGAETVLSNVRVIAIDQQLMQGAAPNAGDTPARTVTLEVDPDQAQRISVAMRLGTLSLAVRAAAKDPPDEATEKSKPTWAKDVLPSMLSQAAPPVENTVRIFRGGKDVKEFRF